MTNNVRPYPSQPTVDLFIKASRAIGYATHQDNKGGFVIVFGPESEPNSNDEAEFFGQPADFIDFVLAKLTEKAHIERPKNLEGAMTLQGVKLFLLRNWTPEAADAYYKMAGVAFSSNSLVPIGVNGVFTELVELQSRLNKTLKPVITPDELCRQYLLNKANKI